MTKKIVAVILALVTVVSVCVTTVFAAYDKTKLDYGTAYGQYEVVPGVKYSEYKATSGTGKSVKGTQVSILEFSPDEYIPVVYNGWSGSLSKLSNTYATATQKDGYEVAGVINGSFFSMSNGWLLEYFVSDGKVSCASVNASTEVIAFMSDGTVKTVNSKLDFGLYLDGKPVANALYAINKHYTKTATWTDGFYYFDSDCGRVTDTYEEKAGYEIICEKLDNTDLTVGGTLKGKVVEVKKNSYGSQVSTDSYTNSDTFVLFCLANSKYKSYAESLKAGSTVEISVDETVEASKETIRNAQSVIANVGWLVKDGVDMTEKQTSIGSHDVETTYAQWTALGTKPDGTYVFFTSDAVNRNTGDSLVLKDVAKMMIDLGCNNVWRMDGGGSTSMYVCDTGNGEAGYKLVTEDRSVADSIMIVKRSSMQKEEYKVALKQEIQKAQSQITESSSKEFKDAIANAEAVLDSATSVNGDYLKAMMNLQKVFGGTAELDELIASCAAISTGDYSEYALKEIWKAYSDALTVRANASSTPDNYNAAATALKSAIAAKGDIEINFAPDSDRTLSAPRGGYRGNLFDGVSSGTLYGADTVWYGFTTGGYATFDLGEVRTDLSKLTYCLLPNNSGDGVVCPQAITLFTSEDGKTWHEVAKKDYSAPEYADYHKNSTAATYWETFDLSGIHTRYIKLGIEGSWTFISEIEIYRSFKTVKDYVYVTGFNSKIAAGDTIVFTKDFSGCSDGMLDVSAANLNWTQAVSFKHVQGDTYEAVSVVSNPSGAGVTSVPMPEGGIVIAAHWDDTNADKSIQDKTKANREALTQIKVGDQIVLHGIYAHDAQLLPGGYVTKVKANMPGDDDYGTVKDGVFNIDPKFMKDGKTLSASKLIEAYGSSTTILDKDGKAITGNTAVGTGATVICGGTRYTVVIKGDVNGDGKINISDATLIKRDIQKLSALESVYHDAALLGKSSKTSIVDYTKLKRFIQFGTNY